MSEKEKNNNPQMPGWPALTFLCTFHWTLLGKKNFHINDFILHIIFI